MPNLVHETYGNRLRVRACGILVHGERLLMVNHHLSSNRDFWAPPGGGVEFGESATSCLEREILEETGLRTEAGEFLFACEFLHQPLHAVELFFRVKWLSGELLTGTDPEMRSADQIIERVRFLDTAEIRMHHPNELHGIFQFVGDPLQVAGLRGYFKL